jgi:hypothetical protein
MALGQDAPYGSVCSVPRELNLSTLISTIGYTKVFGRVHRHELCEIMNGKSFPEQFTKIQKSLYIDTTLQMTSAERNAIY